MLTSLFLKPEIKNKKRLSASHFTVYYNISFFQLKINYKGVTFSSPIEQKLQNDAYEEKNQKVQEIKAYNNLINHINLLITSCDCRKNRKDKEP